MLDAKNIAYHPSRSLISSLSDDSEDTGSLERC